MAGYEFVIRSNAAARPGRWAFPSRCFVIGSGSAAGLRVSAPAVALLHAEITVDDAAQVWVRDLTGAGRTSVDGRQIKSARLSVGATLKLGELELEFHQLEAQARTEDHPVLGGVASPDDDDAPTLRPATPTNAPALGDEPDRDLVHGEVVGGRYRIDRKLAEGGMGEVYLAEHVELQKRVALKIMLPSLSADPQFVARFKAEAVSVTRIGHQNIVDVSDFGQTDDARFYFVMEWLDGVTLTTLARHGALSIERTVGLVLQIARALAAAHDKGIVHRDLKPDNVMVLQRPERADFVKVLDFGVAKLPRSATHEQTAVGTLVGTPAYMSPEVIRGLSADARADIYALGLITRELLTGTQTFIGGSGFEVMSRQVNEPPPPWPDALVDRLPLALGAMVMKMLEKAPERRPQSLHEVVSVLESIDARQAPPRAEATLPPSSPSRAGLGVLVALALGIVAVVVAMTVSEEKPTPPPEAKPLAPVSAVKLPLLRLPLGGSEVIKNGNLRRIDPNPEHLVEVTSLGSGAWVIKALARGTCTLQVMAKEGPTTWDIEVP
jgi:serine/threonine protein kinase